MNDLAKVTTGVQRAAPNPLTQLPAELVEPAGKFFAFYSDSLKGTTGLVSRLLWWMRSREDGGEGLSLADAKAALESLMRPDKAGRSDYAGQVLAALAREVEQVLDARRAADKANAHKMRAVADAMNRATPDVIRKLVAGIGSNPTEEASR